MFEIEFKYFLFFILYSFILSVIVVLMFYLFRYLYSLINKNKKKKLKTKRKNTVKNSTNKTYSSKYKKYEKQTKTDSNKTEDEDKYIETIKLNTIYNNKKSSYIFEYQNENDFRKKERSVRKYNMLAYKKLTFEYYPKIRNGEFLGELVNSNDNTKNYELVLPTDEMFAKVHGEIRLHYAVCEEKNIVILTNITPEGILEEGHRAELITYNGVMISKKNSKKDMFKINLLNEMQKK